MIRYLFRRLLATVPVVLLTSIIVFGLMRLLPGDPVIMMLGSAQTEVSDETVAQLRKDAGLDKPIHEQYAVWMERVLVGDFGRSSQNREPVLGILMPRIWPTVQIGLSAWLLAIFLAIPIGIFSAAQQGTWKDSAGTLFSLVGASMPYFLIGGLLISVISIELGLLPASGFVAPWDDPWASVRSTILPAITLSLGFAAIIARQTRSSFADVLQQAYIKTARAKGVDERRVLLRHAFKNAILPIVTLLGIQLGTLFSGAVITETIFAIPGVGRLLVDSILSRDYPVVQGVVLFITIAVVATNLVVDVLYWLLDPRLSDSHR